MLDADLAQLYGVETRRLVEQVKRNIERFPADFNIGIMRAFVELRRAASSQAAIEKRLDELERDAAARPSAGATPQPA